jgi:hypothetical protein
METPQPADSQEPTAGYAVYNTDRNAIVPKLTSGPADDSVLGYQEAHDHLNAIREEQTDDAPHLEVVKIDRLQFPEADSNADVVEQPIGDCDIGDLIKLPHDHRPSKHAGTWVRLIDFCKPTKYGPRVWVYAHPETGAQLNTLVTSEDDHRTLKTQPAKRTSNAADA